MKTGLRLLFCLIVLLTSPVKKLTAGDGADGDSYGVSVDDLERLK